MVAAFFLLCALSVAQAQIFPITWLYANYTGTTKIPGAGSFNLKGWFATHYDQANEMSRTHSYAVVTVSGVQTTSESLAFTRNGVVETYVVVQGERDELQD